METGKKESMQEFLYRLQLVRGDMLRTGPTDSEQAVVAEHLHISRTSTHKAS